MVYSKGRGGARTSANDIHYQQHYIFMDGIQKIEEKKEAGIPIERIIGNILICPQAKCQRNPLVLVNFKSVQTRERFIATMCSKCEYIGPRMNHEKFLELIKSGIVKKDNMVIADVVS